MFIGRLRSINSGKHSLYYRQRIVNHFSTIQRHRKRMGGRLHPAFAQTPNPVDVPENATATQTLHAAHLHLMRYFRRTAIQAIARAEGRAVEEAKMAEGEGSDWG